MTPSQVHELPNTPEQRLLRAFRQLQREYTECVPKISRVYMMDDLVVYRAQGILSTGEQQLAADERAAKMLRELIDKQWQEIKPMIRRKMQPELQGMIGAIGIDVDTIHDELVIIIRYAAED